MDQEDREVQVKPAGSSLFRWSRKATPTLRSIDGSIKLARKELAPDGDTLSSIGWRLGAAAAKALQWMEANPCPDKISDSDIVDLLTTLADTAASIDTAAQAASPPDLKGFDSTLASVGTKVTELLATSSG
ncbi:MAG: hypothetical protein IVW52_16680 [Acidimicrobiales bacterium]|nr:hypothetical protein [Acidimicrobiales bacterium]